MKKLLLLFSFARADLPVHCIHEEIVGDWTLHLGKPSKFRSFCGHAHPDNETSQPNTDEWLAMNEGYKIYDISLNQLNGAIMHGDKPRDGKWTVIYDEGWEVKFDSLAFFAFSRFDFVNGKNVSQCGGTMVGWYNDNRDDWGCYVAVKKGLMASKLKTKPEKVRAKERKRVTKPAKVAFVQSNENVEKVLDLVWHEAKVKEINAQGSTWKAKVYSKWVGKTYRELNMHAGISRGNSGMKEALTFIEKDQCEDEFAHRYPKKGDLLPNLLSLHQMPPKPCSLTKLAQIQSVNAEEEKKIESKFSTAFSWGPLGFLEPVVDQGECGSCYIVSTMSMLTARHRIATNNTKAPPWSIAFPLYCSEYNQGCKGGYAFLASKWAHDVGLIPATCAPYTTKGKCHVNCDLSKTPRFHATEYQYVGGWYGNSSVYAIMHELHTNGPIVVSFEPSDDFMFYAGGIFMSIPTKLNMGWQKVDHAVLLVGWGEEFGQKYWLVQNSWGKEWGEKGFFRIARGQNDCGIESIAVSAKVVPDERRDVLNQFVMHAGAGKVG